MQFFIWILFIFFQFLCINAAYLNSFSIRSSSSKTKEVDNNSSSNSININNNNLNDSISSSSTVLPSSLSSSSSSSNVSSPTKWRVATLRPIIKKFMSLFISDKDVLNMVSTTLSGTLWFFITMSFIGTIGIDTKPLVSLVTISGFTLGLAAKDIITSTIAAAYIISMRPFKREMTISVGDHVGKVKSFDTNFVKLITSDGKLVLIPMASVYGKPIVIHSKVDEI